MIPLIQICFLVTQSDPEIGDTALSIQTEVPVVGSWEDAISPIATPGPETG